MRRFRKLIRVLLYEPNKIAMFLLYRVRWFVTDKAYVKLEYRFRVGRKLELKNPYTFTEKLQWLKLYDRNPLYTTLVDKYAVKPWVAERIGEQYIIPTLGVWNSFDEIDFDKLPNRFVLKTTHGGGGTGVVICRNKSLFDKKAAKEKLNRSMKISGYEKHREWPYKNVPRRIIAEEYIEPQYGLNELIDYKFFCFNGEPKFCMVIYGRNSRICKDFFDKEWRHQPFKVIKKCPNVEYPNADIELRRPKYFNEMWQLAAQLSVGNPFSRIDFYELENGVKFGEITFFTASGFNVYEPIEYDAILGQMMKLPIDN